MKVAFRRRSLKDLASLPSEVRRRVERFLVEEVPAAESVAAAGKIEQLRGFPDCYKVRFGDYRVGLRLVGETLIVERVLHRREIYRKFP
ncbi:MAG: type II toxin-antitoxin system RelE/ParE family toxin [Thermoanaerobaculia bacterium]|nr:type II toxin-antitoxin system RelE/ParE family toxin [Thermoanaerobaculia bacterium]